MTEPGPRNDDSIDRALVDRWKGGDERAAAELVARHAQALARFAVSLGARDDVEELVQDTFVRAFGSLDGFRAESSLRTWLFSIERRLLLDRRRSERKRKHDVGIDEVELATGYNPLDTLVATEAEGRVREAVGRLSPMQREVFTLRVTEGMAYKEIAEVVGSTEGAARVHYHNALRAVKEFLDA